MNLYSNLLDHSRTFWYGLDIRHKNIATTTWMMNQLIKEPHENRGRIMHEVQLSLR